MAERGISRRRACALLGVPRSTLGYVARMPQKDAPVIERMRHYATLYPRFGYRRIHVYLVGPEEPLTASSHAACGAEGSC